MGQSWFWKAWSCSCYALALLLGRKLPEPGLLKLYLPGRKLCLEFGCVALLMELWKAKAAMDWSDTAWLQALKGLQATVDRESFTRVR